MNSIVQKLLIACVLANASTAPAIIPHNGLSSLKGSVVACLSTMQEAARPAFATIREYPKLAVAFTILSCFCISAVQDIVQTHRAIKTANGKRSNLVRRMKQRQDELEKLEKEEQGLDKSIALDQSKQENIDSEMQHVEKAQCDKQEKSAHSSLATTPEDGMPYNPSLDNTIQQTKEAIERLQANLCTKQQELHTLQQSPETLKHLTENRNRASVIKNRPKITIDAVLLDAQTLITKDAKDKKEVPALKKQILSILEQLKSIVERYELSHKDFGKRYDQQLCNETRDFYPAYTEQDNYYGIITPLATLADISSTFDRSEQRTFDHLFYGGPRKHCAPNLLAKENFDAYLLGEKELARIRPTKEQYEQAKIVREQLSKKLYSLENVLDPRILDEAPIVAQQPADSPNIDGILSLLGRGDAHAKK